MRGLVGSALVLSVGLSACADLNTVSRRTRLAGGGTKPDGVAMHLDVQQRLVMYSSDGKYCAEPSPDALAAYAASLSLGTSVPTQGAASAAAAQQSNAANIGLRTQSITLMRDALYRLCEARAGGKLGVSETMLLARSQDLTAVVVAVEQLTGAVAASQAVLTGTTRSTASAQLVANQQFLDAARKDETAKQTSVDEAKAAQEKQKKVVAARKEDVKTAQGNLDAARKQTPPPSDAELGRLAAKVTAEEDALAVEQTELEKADALVKQREELLAESKNLREIIQDNRDAAMTQATANTAGSGQFSQPVQVKALDENATEQIALSVERMVTQVLKKPYTVETCTTLVTDGRAPGNDEISKRCIDLIAATVEAATAETRLTTASFAPDNSSEAIRQALSTDPALAPRLTDWLRKNASGLSITLLLYGEGYAGLRRRAINDLNIQ